MRLGWGEMGVAGRTCRLGVVLAGPIMLNAQSFSQEGCVASIRPLLSWSRWGERRRIRSAGAGHS